MRIIETSAKEIKEENLLKKIEMVGRTCYKSNNLIKDGSAEKFVRGLSKSKHYAMLEHGVVHFYIPMSIENSLHNALSENKKAWELSKKYTYWTYLKQDDAFLWTVNLRTLVEMSEVDLMIRDFTRQLLNEYAYGLGLKEDGEYVIVNPMWKQVQIFDDVKVRQKINKNFKKDKEARQHEYNKHIFRTFLLTTDRGVTHELVRHRPCSFAQASTRYCNYSKDKFGNEITVIKPLFDENSDAYRVWKQGCEYDEKTYFDLLNCGCKPEEARGNLPTDLATELIITANLEEWEHIFDLRYKGTTGAPHPKCKEVIKKVYNLF